mmetsp:Transcript_75452/g.139012  ORF Transcript_75452/g.139012 Transcript_75452/m.139012 type:complete len:315 (-) Transcript_75452:674-1618(-)
MSINTRTRAIRSQNRTRSERNLAIQNGSQRSASLVHVLRHPVLLWFLIAPGVLRLVRCPAASWLACRLQGLPDVLASALYVSGLPDDKDILDHRLLPWDVHLHFVVVLDVAHLGAFRANDVGVLPFGNLKLLVYKTGMRDLVMSILEDAVDDFFALFHTLSATSNADFELLVRVALWVLVRRLWHVDLHFALLLDQVNGFTALADDVRDVDFAAGDDRLGEIVKCQRAIALLDDLLHSNLCLCDSLRLAEKSASSGIHVERLNSGLLLDHVDDTSLWADDTGNFVLRNLDGHGRHCFFLHLWFFCLCCNCGCTD